jgi:FtsP/CotA-like multicopper oxidase with cupredoxin domain
MKTVREVFGATGLLTLALAAGIVCLPVQTAQAQAIPGLDGSVFDLIADDGYISTPDGGSVYTWGYGPDPGVMQYPGPTLIVTEGDSVEIDLTNNLNVPVSMVFPGHVASAVEQTAPTAPGLLTLEALPGGTVRYTFAAGNPGTFMYHSGTEQDLQIEMGLAGAIIVTPSSGVGAYGHVDATDNYDREFLFFFSEMDSRVHELVEQGQTEWVDTSGTYEPLYWFINGRGFPDTLENESVSWLPHQPYNCLPVFEAGERVLMRYVGAGRQIHPQHPHGNHAQLIARDGRLLLNDAGDIVGPMVATPSITPGQTLDAIFTWTGKGLGWDAYGTGPGFDHSCIDSGDGHDATSSEWCADHGGTPMRRRSCSTTTSSPVGC